MAPELTKVVMETLLSYVFSSVERMIDFLSTLQKSVHT